MEQLALNMLTWYSGPRLVDLELIAACKSYREAVAQCWTMRTRKSLTQRALVEEVNDKLGPGVSKLYPSHVSDYLNTTPTKTGKARRELPPDAIDAVEQSCGNRFISQWLAHRARLPVMDAAFLQHIERMRRAA